MSTISVPTLKATMDFLHVHLHPPAVSSSFLEACQSMPQVTPHVCRAVVISKPTEAPAHLEPVLNVTQPWLHLTTPPLNPGAQLSTLLTIHGLKPTLEHPTSYWVSLFKVVVVFPLSTSTKLVSKFQTTNKQLINKL